MNTLRDTSEGKASPSVWPVSVVAVVLGSLGLLGGVLGVLFFLFFGLLPAIEWWPLFLFLVLVGAFDIVVTYGLLRLRRWGWWCGIVALCCGGIASVLALLSWNGVVDKSVAVDSLFEETIDFDRLVRS